MADKGPEQLLSGIPTSPSGADQPTEGEMVLASQIRFVEAQLRFMDALKAGHHVVLEEDAGYTPIRPDDDRTTPYGCAHCHDTGRYVLDVPRGHPAFGNIYDCPQCGADVRAAQRRLDRIFRDSGIPEAEYGPDQVRFEWFRKLPIWQRTYTHEGKTVEGCQPKALEEVEAFSQRDDDSSILIYGEHKGSGKTALASCAHRAIISRTGCSNRFITTIDLLDRIRETYQTNTTISQDEVLSAVRSCQLLTLDDIGAERRKPGPEGAWVVEKLFSIVNWRQTHHLRTIYTSNLDLNELAVHLDGRTSWRIKDHCDPYIVRCEGCNIRNLSRADRAQLIAAPGDGPRPRRPKKA